MQLFSDRAFYDVDYDVVDNRSTRAVDGKNTFVQEDDKEETGEDPNSEDCHPEEVLDRLAQSIFDLREHHALLERRYQERTKKHDRDIKKYKEVIEKLRDLRFELSHKVSDKREKLANLSTRLLEEEGYFDEVQDEIIVLKKRKAVEEGKLKRLKIEVASVEKYLSQLHDRANEANRSKSHVP